MAASLSEPRFRIAGTDLKQLFEVSFDFPIRGAVLADLWNDSSWPRLWIPSALFE